MIDLDAARAARREAIGEAPTVTFGGREFSLPAELPFPAVLLLGDLSEAQEAGDMGLTARTIAAFVEALLGDQYQGFMAQQPSLPDLEVLITAMMEAYGMSVGEAPASGPSSDDTSTPSRPTSSASTALTSVS